MNKVAFFHASAETLARNLQDGAKWRRPISRPGWATLTDMLYALQSPRNVRICAWVPLSADWCALFTNARHGNDVGFQPQLATEELKIVTIFAKIALDSDGAPASTLFAAHFPSCTGEPLDVNSRGLECYLDGSRWTFHQFGEPLPFEDLEAYRRKKRSERLTPAMVYGYLNALGVPYDVDPRWAEAVVVTIKPLLHLP